MVKQEKTLGRPHRRIEYSVPTGDFTPSNYYLKHKNYYYYYKYLLYKNQANRITQC